MSVLVPPPLRWSGCTRELHQKGVSRQQRLARAREFVANPTSLAALFHDSVSTLAKYEPADERSVLQVADSLRGRRRQAVKHDRPSPSDPGRWRIGSRAKRQHAAARDESIDAPGVETVLATDLACDFLDRELVATRTTGGATHEGTQVRLDLLLCNSADRTPIIVEVKRTSDPDPLKQHRRPATDKDPFSALIQALACAAQLSTPAQYARLARWGRTEARGKRDYPSEADIVESDPPVFDVYVVLHNRATGTHLAELGEEAERVAALLLAPPAVARHVRRIACLLTRSWIVTTSAR